VSEALLDFSEHGGPKGSPAAMAGGEYHVSSATAGDYFSLLKPRVMSLVVFTGLAGLVAAPVAMNPFAAFTALLCIAVGAGASGALNMWYDADIDAMMARTAKRPIPSGRVTPQEALTFGLTLSAFSVGVMGILVNWLSAGLLAFTIVFYVLVYTMWLKRWTQQNIVIGGLAGAVPPAIGWAAATGTMDVAPLVMVAIIFLWTPPHFWALALYRSGDYAKAGVPMLPVVAGEAETRRQIVIYSVAMVACSLLPSILGHSGLLYTVAAVLGGAGFIWLSVRVLRSPGDTRIAMKLFAYSIFYLFGLFATIIIETAAGIPPLVLS
jgi:protoheme IX farnesyltransferase